jgi:hypothetical protein
MAQAICVAMDNHDDATVTLLRTHLYSLRGIINAKWDAVTCRILQVRTRIIIYLLQDSYITLIICSIMIISLSNLMKTFCLLQVLTITFLDSGEISRRIQGEHNLLYYIYISLNFAFKA